MTIKLVHIAYVAIFVLIAALTYQSYRLSVKISRLNDVNVELALAKEKLSHKQDSIDLLAGQAIVLKDKSDSLGLVANKLQKDKEILYGKLEDALAAIDSIPTEDNYIFLQDSAYNYPGDRIYPFNGKQVTEIRKAYVENYMIKKINVNLATTVNILRKQNSTQDSLISNQYVQLNLYSDMIRVLNGTVDKQSTQNRKLNKDIIRQKRRTFLFEGTTIAGVVFILISLIK